MSDRYIDFANSSLGHRLVAAIGLPSPVRLERWQAGRLRPVEAHCCWAAARWPPKCRSLRTD